MNGAPESGITTGLRRALEAACLILLILQLAICAAIAFRLCVELGVYVGGLIDDLAQYWYAVFGALVGSVLATLTAAIFSHQKKNRAVTGLIRVVEQHQRRLGHWAWKCV